MILQGRTSTNFYEEPLHSELPWPVWATICFEESVVTRLNRAAPAKPHYSIRNETFTVADTLIWPIESVLSLVSGGLSML